MNRTPKIWIILLLVAVVAGAWAVQRLFVLRFAAGDVYPPYSSLRADPLGTKALHDSLGLLPAVKVRRHFEPLTKLRDPRQTTLLVFGVEPMELSFLDPVEVKELEAVPAGGGRMVIGLAPASREPRRSWLADEEEETSEDQSDKDHKKKRKDQEDERLRLTSLGEEWGFAVAYADAPAGSLKGLARRADDDVEADGLPVTVTWHSVTWFDKLHDKWQVVYAVDERPVIIERSMGGGTVVLCADSYLVSNEALLKEREPGLLAWLIGRSPDVVFEEAHFGIARQAGVMTLARRYRLHGLLAGLVALAGLFVWRNAARFVPPTPVEPVAVAPPTEGRDAAAALINLLRRSVARDRLLAVCVREWKRSLAHGRADVTEKLGAVESLATRALTSKEIVTAYHELRRMLAKKTIGTPPSPAVVAASQTAGDGGVPHHANSQT